MLQPLSFYGERLDNKNLGEGSFGYVYRIGRKTGEQFAVKVFKHLDQNGISVDTIREIAILFKVNHPNILKLIDIANFSVERPEPISVVLELGAMSLRNFMSMPHVYQNKKTNEALFCSYSYQLIRALTYLHDNDIWHRDLKPENMLIFSSGKIVISDFGIARCNAIPGSAYTGRIQSLWYRSPEILLGSHFYGPEVDIFSLGVVLTELWTNGHPIFAYDQADDVLKRQISFYGHFTEADWPGITGMQGYTLNLAKFANERIVGKWDMAIARFGLNSELLKILKEMTIPNPSKRITLEEASTSSVFDGVRRGIENELPFEIIVETSCGQVLDQSLVEIDPSNLWLNEFTKTKSDYYHKIFQFFSDVKDKFRLNYNTYFHARLLFDAFLRERVKIHSRDLISITTKTLQLVATGCLLVSIKLIEIHSVRVDDLVKIGDGAYSKEDLLRMELNILKVIKFNLVYPLPTEYVSKYTYGFDSNHLELVNRLMEFFCITYNKIDSKMIAQNATAIVVKCVGYHIPFCLEKEFEDKTNFTIEEIRKIKPFINVYLERNEDLNQIINLWPNCNLKSMEIDEIEDKHDLDEGLTEINYSLKLHLINENPLNRLSREELGMFAKEIIMNYLINRYIIKHELNPAFIKYFNLQKGFGSYYIPPENLPEKINVLIGMFKDHYVNIFVNFDQFPESEELELQKFMASLLSNNYKIHNRYAEGYLSDN